METKPRRDIAVAVPRRQTSRFFPGAALFVGGALSSVCLAADPAPTPPTMPAAVTPSVADATNLVPPSLGGPEVVKLDWNMRGLMAADLDGDGRNDLLVINNDRSRIEMLYQRAPGSKLRTPRRVVMDRWEPELEDARFEKRPLTTGITVFDMAVGDLNGDGRPDLAYTGDPDALTIRYQSKDGDWDDKRVYDIGKPGQYLTTIKIADLDGDKRDDLVILLQKELVVIRQNSKGELGPPERYALSEEGCYSLDLVDVDGDGRLDVVYLAITKRDGLRVRLQQPDGTLGPERPFRTEYARSTLQIFDRGHGQTPAFAYVQNQTSMLGVVTLEKETKAETSATSLKPRVYSTHTGSKLSPSYAFGDFDGDGRLDLAIADPDGAQIYVYFQTATGELAEGRPFPSLADSRSIAAVDWDGDGRSELFVASPKEQTLGSSNFTKNGRLSYPQPIPTKGKPIAVDAVSGRGTAGPMLAVAIEEGGKRRIDFLVRREGAVQVLASVELVGLKTDPRAIRFLDANQDGRPDLAVFVPYEAMRLIVQKGDGQFVDVSNNPNFRKGLVENLDPSALTLADVDGDGKAEMLVAGNGFARALKLDASDTLQVVDQFNAREAGTDIGAAFVADVDGDGKRDIVLLDRKNDQLQVLTKNAQGVYIFSDAVPVSRIDLIGAVQLDLSKDGVEDMFFLGKDRFWVVPVGAKDFHVETLFTYETDLKDVRYDDVAMGDLNNDGVSDFVMVDAKRNLIEILVRSGMTVKSALHFQVFEADPHAPRKGNMSAEPRETVVSDVTGDGKKDLILLVHDRILIYPQQ